jgi:hypothetical protein
MKCCIYWILSHVFRLLGSKCTILSWQHNIFKEGSKKIYISSNLRPKRWDFQSSVKDWRLAYRLLTKTELVHIGLTAESGKLVHKNSFLCRECLENVLSCIAGSEAFINFQISNYFVNETSKFVIIVSRNWNWEWCFSLIAAVCMSSFTRKFLQF